MQELRAWFNNCTLEAMHVQELHEQRKRAPEIAHRVTSHVRKTFEDAAAESLEVVHCIISHVCKSFEDATNDCVEHARASNRR